MAIQTDTGYLYTRDEMCIQRSNGFTDGMSAGCKMVEYTDYIEQQEKYINGRKIQYYSTPMELEEYKNKKEKMEEAIHDFNEYEDFLLRKANSADLMSTNPGAYMYPDKEV